MPTTIIYVNIVEVSCWAKAVSALPEWHTVHLEISLAEPLLFKDPKRSPELTVKGAGVFRCLQSVSGLRVYFPAEARTANGMMAEIGLDRYADGGFMPDVVRLMSNLAKAFDGCGFDLPEICSGLTPESREALVRGAGKYGDILSAWPNCPGERFSA